MSDEKAGKIATSKAMKEDIDLGHQDDEPDMLKASVYRIAKYAVELYKMLDKYDQMNAEVDFPDWWQEKIHLAKDYMVKAKHYLDFEEKQPSLDMMTEEVGDKATQKYIQNNIKLSTFDTEENILKKIYGDNLSNLKRYETGLYTGDLGNMSGLLFMFSPSRDTFRVYKSVQDLIDYRAKLKGVPANEFYLFQDEFNKKAIDFVVVKMPRVTKPSIPVDEDLTPSTLDMGQDDMLDNLIRKYMDQYVNTKTDDFVDRYGEDAEKVMYGAAVKRAKQDMEERGLPVREKMDPIGKKAIASSIAKKIKK
jgi:hypothetical protein